MRKKNKESLIAILRALEPSESGKLDSFKIKSVIDAFEKDNNDTDQEFASAMRLVVESVSKSLGKYHSAMGNAIQNLATRIDEHTETIHKGLRSVDTSIRDGAPKDFSGFFKDIGTQLVQGNKYSKDTSELIRNLKWNSSMQIRSGTTGAPLDPHAVAPSISIGNGTVTTAGTAVQLSSTSLACTRVMFCNNDANGSLTNNGTLTIGDSTVVGAQATRKGLAVYAGNSVELYVSNLNLLWVDSTDNGAKYHFYVEKFS